MKKKFFAVVSFAVLASLAFSCGAFASMMIPAADRAKENSKAPEYSPAIGDNWDLERVDFIHYAKPSVNPAKPSKETVCYKLTGVSWKAFPVNYAINPANPYGLDETAVAGAVSASAEAWDAATSTELFGDAYVIDYTAQYGVQNYENAIVFGDYPDSNVIGVTSVWYTRVGKKIVEFDIMLNTDFVWGDAELNSAVMDLRNIATHELGHAVGMSDIYTSSCSAVTMYGYSGYGETAKRTLEAADIQGLQQMYGI